MEITQLHHFVNVVQCGGFRSAAKRCHVSPPAISKSIQRLEESVGAKLLVRSTRQVVLTEAGRLVLERCHRVFAELDALKAELDRASTAVCGELRIAANEVFSLSLLPAAVSSLVGRHPEILPRSYEMIPGRFERWLHEGRIDLACTIGGQATTRLRRINIGSSEGCLVCGPKHPLYDAGRVTAEDLQRYPSVVPEFFEMEHLPSLDQFPDQRFPRRVGATIELLQMGVELAVGGRYLGFFPRITIENQLADGRLKALQGLAFGSPFQLDLFVRDGQPLRPAVEELIDELKRLLAPE